MISNCGHDERNKYNGGQAGDQTGQEWAVIPWYNRPWNVVLRHQDPDVGTVIAELARKAAENNLIGYDQSQRTTYWTELKKANYDPAKIRSACEADCSSGVAANVKAAGMLLGDKSLQNVSIYAYTGNLETTLKAAGFRALTDQKYLSSDMYLLPGDVLLLAGHHTAVNLTIGSKAFQKDPGGSQRGVYPGWVQSGTEWYYRLSEGQNQRGWKAINHHWYYFDEKGKMLKGWFQVKGDWYYGQPDGPLEGALYHTNEKGVQSIWFVP